MEAGDPGTCRESETMVGLGAAHQQRDEGQGEGPGAELPVAASRPSGLRLPRRVP